MDDTDNQVYLQEAMEAFQKEKEDQKSKVLQKSFDAKLAARENMNSAFDSHFKKVD